MEFQNIRTNNRKNLFLWFSITFISALFYAFFKYYFAEPEYKAGLKYSQYSFSYDEFIFFTIAVSIISLLAVTYSKIIIKIIINETDKTLSIEVIERFKITAKKYTVPLARIKITKEINPNANDKYNYNAKYISHVLILSNEEFGDIYINDVDFIEINKIIDIFEEMRVTASVKLRSRRLTKKKK